MRAADDNMVVPVWELAVPLPAVLMITVALYVVLVGVGLWVRFCLKDRCSCHDCCPDFSVCDQCFHLAQMCDFRAPSLRACLPCTCPTPTLGRWDCACTCQPPECESCNCLCFEIRIK